MRRSRLHDEIMTTHDNKMSISCLNIMMSVMLCAVGNDVTPEMTTGNHSKTMVIEGDVNLGVILSVNEREESYRCGNRLRETGAVQFVEGVVYAVSKVNSDPKLLPDVKLGVVIVDDCTNAVTALGSALQFLPVNADRNCYNKCSGGGGGSADKSSPSSSDENLLKFYDVVGVIGAESSPSSINVAKLLGMFGVPQISPSATSDRLSDKKTFPYFMRMAPPDRYQVKAMLNLFRHFDWSYVAAVYSKSSYGEGGVEQLRSAVSKLSSAVCIGDALGIPQNPSPAIVNRIVARLDETGARVVVLFTDQEETRLVLDAILRRGLAGRFVFVGSDGVGINLDDLRGAEAAVLGALTLKTYSVEVPGFFDYFESLTPENASGNPWFVDMWSELFPPPPSVSNASLPAAAKASERRSSLRQAPHYSRESTVSLTIDTVYVFARAIDRLVRDRCSQEGTESAPLGPTTLSRCIRGSKQLLGYLRNTTFAGHNGWIRFDENGDIRGKYEVMNVQRIGTGTYGAVRVGVWDTVTERLEINDSLIVWGPGEGGTATGAGAGAGAGARAGAVPGAIPESKCGEKCHVGEVYSYFRDTCCWECRRCAVNERTVANATRCSPCPSFAWPNRNFTACHPIPPAFVEWNDPVILFVVSLSGVGIVYCAVVGAIYARHNADRLIKSTSRELSYLMWVGVVLQYLLLFCVVSKPNSMVCKMSYAGFNISFSVVYAPLLTRTNRIYRLFQGGIRGKALPSLTSPLSQVVITLMIVSVQVLINTVVFVADPPRVDKRMPVATEPYMELACSDSLTGFMTSLSYNVLLVVVCTYYAFKTRSLPDNFNESRYITFCVYTTLVIWLVFIPSYFTSLRVYQKTIVLSSALLLNATVTLLCLFTPKIYALYRPGSAINSFKYSIDTTTTTTTTANQGRSTVTAGAEASSMHVSRSAPNLDLPSAGAGASQRVVRVDFARRPSASVEASQTNGAKTFANQQIT